MTAEWKTKTAEEVFEDIVRTMQHIEYVPNALNLPLFIFKYPKASRKMRKAHVLWVSRAIGMKLKEAKDLCRKASK